MDPSMTTRRLSVDVPQDMGVAGDAYSPGLSVLRDSGQTSCPDASRAIPIAGEI
jgi:hypothetical protein